MDNNSATVRKANSLSLAGMILGIISAAYGACMYVIVWALMISGPPKAIIAVVIGIILSIAALVISRTAKKNGATSRTFNAGIGTSTGGLIVSSALLVILIVYIVFVILKKAKQNINGGSF